MALADAGAGGAKAQDLVREPIEDRRRVPGESLGAGTLGQDCGDAGRVESVRRQTDI